MSEKDCGSHGKNKHKRLRRFCAGLLILCFVLLLTVLLVWAILQPSKPRFVLQDVTVYNLNTSVPNFVSSNFAITLSARNPNDKIGIYYDRLDVFAVYRTQQITYRTRLPPTYQGHKDVNTWSPFVYGNDVPIAPFNSAYLIAEQGQGFVWISFKAQGRVRWKVGAFVSGRYHIYVRCDAMIRLGNTRGEVTVVENNAVKYQLVKKCRVSV